jgi:transposase
MGRFPSAAHLASWAGMCPGNYESAGKRQKGRTRRGNKAVRRALTEAAQAAARNKKTDLAAQWRRLVIRRGKKKAAVAVGHTILRIVYHGLSRREPYHELGATYLDERQRTRTQHRAIAQLQALGFAVTLTPTEPAA